MALKKSVIIVLICFFMSVEGHSQKKKEEGNEKLRSGPMELCEAIAEGNIKAVETLIKKGIDVDLPVRKDEFPLFYAAGSGRPEITRLLIQAGVNINIKDSYGDTALHIAIREGHYKVAEILINSGADINAKIQKGFFPGFRPLHTAVNGKMDIPQIVSLLISKGADISSLDAKGKTPIQYAIMNHFHKSEKILSQQKKIQGHIQKKTDFLVFKGCYPGQKPPGVESKNFVDPIDMQTLEKAKIIARRIMIIDCHSHNLFQPGSTDKPRQVSFSMLKQSGVKGIVQSLPLDFKAINNPSKDILKNIKDTKNKIKKESLNISVALKSSDFFSPNRDDSFTIMLGIEYFKGIFGGNIKMLEKYHKEGVRVIGIVRTGGLDNIYVNNNLTEFGSELIGEMNRLGIICDITHLTESAQIKIIEASQAPVILSHTNAYSVVNSGFNVTDTTLEKLTAKGGIICVTFFSGQLSRRALNYLKEKKNLNQLPRASIDELVDQIDYLKKKVGIDYIGIGSDYGGSGRMSPEGLETIEGFPMIIYYMLKRNYSKNEIEKVMGLNFIHFYERVENKAELQKGNVNTQQDDFPVLKGPYLGQEPPGITPEIFAPGIISTKNNNEALFCMYMDGNRLFLFTRSSSGAPGQIYYPIYMTEMKDGHWTIPSLTTFHSKACDDNLSLVPDDKTLYFASKRSRDGSGVSPWGFNIWIVKKTAQGFSNPRLLDPPINSDDYDICPSVTKDGTIYFFSERNGGFGHADIYRSKIVDGKYTDVENLGKPINTENSEIDPFIALDESYLIYCSKMHAGYGGHDLYITFRKQDGSWTEPVNMGEEINSSSCDWIPYVTSDGKYFFFTSNRTGDYDIYWVDAKIIEQLRPKELKKRRTP